MANSDNIKLIMPNEENVTLSARSVDKLIQRADGEAALLYLYILRNGGQFNTAQAAKTLAVTENDTIAAMNRLIKMGLIQGQDSPSQHLQEDKLPDYSTEDFARANSDPVFTEIRQEVADLMGRLLSPYEINTLLGIYKELGFEPGVILMLVNYCIEQASLRYDSRKVPTMRYIEKVAFSWEHMGILTVEDAEAYIKKLETARDKQQKIKKVLQIKDRELGTTEKKYVDAWIDMGFDTDAIEIAYDRTLVKTGRLAWAYMNSILKNWHDKKMHTADEILSNDGKNTKQAPSTMAATPEQAAFQLESMRRFLDELNKQ